MEEPGMRPVRSNRSNPALKQALAKARFWKKEYNPNGKDFAEGEWWVEIVF